MKISELMNNDLTHQRNSILPIQNSLINEFSERMNFREATEKDIPEIVSVLKASLGEDQLELSEKVWRYKHIDNPFGKSIVLLAEVGGEIIGVRALMRWKWQQGNVQFSALRAVDTATHPNYQGKGIFKKLTLQAVEIAKNCGDHFIFNTPNEKSRPGYLKMGWEEVGKVNIGLKPSFSFLKIKKALPVYKIEKNISADELENLCKAWNSKLSLYPGIFTPKSTEILNWRYEVNPLQSYEVQAGKGFYLATYIKNRGKFRELRIAECLFDQTLLNDNDLRKIIRKAENKFGCHGISFSPQLLKLLGIRGNLGPVLTFKALNLMSEEQSMFMSIQKWNNSIGDLELF